MIATSKSERRRAEAAGLAGKVGLDAILGRAAEARPDAVALVDAPNRAGVLEGAPLRLTFAECASAVTALAADLETSDLKADSVVATLLANSAETPLALLAAMRCGWLPAALPLTWSPAEAAAATVAHSPRGFIVSGRASGIDLAAIAGEAAADMFCVRHVMSFASKPADGIRPLSIDTGAASALAASPRPGITADHAALLSFDATDAAAMPVAFSHNQLVAAGMLALIEAGIDSSSRILSTVMASSLGGMVGAVMPWLLGGCRLVLQQPFADEAFLEALDAEDVTHCVLPGPVFYALCADAAFAERLSRLEAVLLVWRRPEMATRLAVPVEGIRIVDLHCLGEIACLARARAGETPSALRAGPVGPSAAGDGPVFCELRLGEDGMLAIRGALCGTPLGAEGPQQPGADDYRPTGLSALAEGDALIVEGPHPAAARGEDVFARLLEAGLAAQEAESDAEPERIRRARAVPAH